MYIIKLELSKFYNQKLFTEETFILWVFNDKDIALDNMYNYINWYKDVSWEWDDNGFVWEYEHNEYGHVVSIEVTKNFTVDMFYSPPDLYAL